ncbi:MAG: hypothetical protein EOM67_03650 [Spirochaetia bacterium]|nr:hypothetical protein [Spirochaetia bacterium]
MADLRFEGKNNQKKGVSIFSSEVITTSATMNDTLFTLPANSLVTAVYAVVTTGSGSATNTVDVKVGTTVVANEVIVGVVGVASGTVAKTFFPTGGSVTVVAGADAPGTTGKVKIVIVYIETELTTGTYTD